MTLLVDVFPDLIKLDRHLIVGLHMNRVHQKVVKHIKALCDDLGVGIIAEGIKAKEEFEALGLHLLQGRYLAKPQLEALQTEPDCVWA